MSSGAGIHPRILLVDDDRGFCELVTHWLGDTYELESAHDGESGVARAKLERPDLILLDVMMPRLSGFSLAWVFKHDPFFAGTPVVFCTAHAEEWPNAAESLARADAYLLKPFGMAKLRDTIAGLLSRAPDAARALGTPGPDTAAGPCHAVALPATARFDDGDMEGSIEAMAPWGLLLHCPDAHAVASGARGQIELRAPDGGLHLACRVISASAGKLGLRLRFPDAEHHARYQQHFKRVTNT